MWSTRPYLEFLLYVSWICLFICQYNTMSTSIAPSKFLKEICHSSFRFVFLFLGLFWLLILPDIFRINYQKDFQEYNWNFIKPIDQLVKKYFPAIFPIISSISLCLLGSSSVSFSHVWWLFSEHNSYISFLTFSLTVHFFTFLTVSLCIVLL